MQYVVKKKPKRCSIVYRISRTDFPAIVYRQFPRIVPEDNAVDNFVLGSGTLFNIPGYSNIQIHTSMDDMEMIRGDWDRVGQSLLDGVIMLSKQ